jgi:hypothetical protein
MKSPPPERTTRLVITTVTVSVKGMQPFGVLAIFLLSLLRLSAGESTTLTFEESNELIANPYMGWQTFHHFADEDATLRGLPSGSAYFRFYWRELEPVEGQIDLKLIDELLAHARKAGQKLSIGIMICGSEQYMDAPAWLKAQGCSGYEFRYEGDQIVYRKMMLGVTAFAIATLLIWLAWKRRKVKDAVLLGRVYRRYVLAHVALILSGVLVWKYAGAKHWVPDFDDPHFRKAHTRLITELGKHLDAHPDFDLIDIASVGLWGEWHMAHTPRVDTGENVAMPPDATLKEIVDLYCAAFPTAAKAMLLNEPPVLMHALSRGCGWRADSFGDMGGDSKEWSHMESLYPKWIAAAHAEDAWKTGPVAFESAWDMQRWAREGWDIHDIFERGLKWHVSYLNNKSAPLPDQCVEDVKRFILKMGYRLVLRSVEFPKEFLRGKTAKIGMKWDNVGVAPPYRDGLIALRLSAAKSEIIMSKSSVKGMLPGPADYETEFEIPSTLQPGTYRAELVIVDPVQHGPLMQIAVKGATREGVKMGEFEVK